MPSLALNDRTIARPKLARDTYFDTQARGLALRVGAKSRVWYFVYRNGGSPAWFKLGTYPSVPLAEARTLALDKRHDLDIKGIDPAVERRKEPEPPPATPQAFTFTDFVPAFIAFQKGRKKTWYDDEAMIARYLTPAWGPLPLNSITRKQVQERLDDVTGKGLTVGVNRLQALISRIFTVALDKGHIETHPAHRMIKRFSEQPRERVLTDDELRALWAGLDAQPGAASDAIRLRLLLGQRGEETAGMLWQELHLDEAYWALPGTRTKNRKAHVVALPPTALALLKERRRHAPKDAVAVFPALALTGDEHKALNSIHSGSYEWTDLRRTVATRLADLGFDETLIGRVLNHVRHTVTGRHYDQHRYVEEIRQALNAWDGELQRILANVAKTPTRVLPMRRRR
jgi:integrase